MYFFCFCVCTYGVKGLLKFIIQSVSMNAVYFLAAPWSAVELLRNFGSTQFIVYLICYDCKNLWYTFIFCYGVCSWFFAGFRNVANYKFIVYWICYDCKNLWYMFIFCYELWCWFFTALRREAAYSSHKCIVYLICYDL